MKKLLFALAFILPLMVFQSCSEDEYVYPDITLYHGDVYTLKGGNGGWRSENVLIAKVDGEDITAGLAGVTRVSNGENSFKVTVKPTNNLYEEPYMQWGSSISVVSQYMKNNGYEPLDDNDENGLMYYGKDPVDYVLYAFKDGKLYSSGVYIPVDYQESLSDFFAQRYILLSQKNSQLTFTDPYKTLYIGMKSTIYNNKVYYLIAYGSAE